MATARTIITDALRVLKILPAREQPTADEVADALRFLNAMLATWSTSRLLVPRITQEAVTVSTSPVTLASRPMRVMDSTVNDGGQDYPVAAVSREDWFSITDKTLTGRPTVLWWDEKITPVYVYLYPVPDKAYALTVQRWDMMARFATVDAAMTFPDEYEEVLVHNLAVRLASQFGAEVPVSVASVASATMAALVKYHAKEVPSLTTDLVGSIQRRYGYDANAAFRGGQ